MGFKSIEIIIEVPLFLNEFPKYSDKMKTQSAHDSICIFSFLVTELLWCMVLTKSSIGTRSSPKKKKFSFLATILLGAWDL